MKLLGVVRVTKLLAPARHVEGTASVVRQPMIGDMGTIVWEGPDLFQVESVDGDGRTVWLAEFKSEELEAVLTR
jgi:hypothetical protein